MKKRYRIDVYIKRIIQSPYLISLLIVLLFLPLMRFQTGSYRAEVVSIERKPSGFWIYYDDLDSDDSAETITFMNKKNASGVMITNEKGLIEQWNIEGSFDFYNTNTLFITGDYNHDGIKEVYFFSISTDSIFLHSVPDFRRPEFGVRNRFVARAGPGANKPDPSILKAEMNDLDGDGFLELIFGISSGFSLYPRQIYAYYIDSDSLVVAGESYAALMGELLLADIDQDGKMEIIPSTGAPSNTAPDSVKIHDNSSWLIILDSDLRYKYTPHEFNGRYSFLTPFFYINPNNQPVFICYHNIREIGRNSRLILMDPGGQEVKSVDIPDGSTQSFLIKDHSGEYVVVIQNKNNTFSAYNNELNLAWDFSPEIPSIMLFNSDIDADGEKELCLLSSTGNTLSIYRQGFRKPARVAIDTDDVYYELAGLVGIKGNNRLIAIQGHNTICVLSYGKNPLYFSQFLIPVVIYIVLLLFAFVIQKLQLARLREKQQTERRMHELQLSHIRNQLDPHFTLNVLNNISSVFITGRSKLAMQYYTRFTWLLRQVLSKSEEWQVTLGEELKFIETYLEIESLRMEGKLEFVLSVAENVKNEVPIPKMLIHTFVENAVKHGLKPTIGEKRLTIDVQESSNKVEVHIVDNGIGREKAKLLDTGGTGKGLDIVNQIIDTHKKLFDRDISYSIEDIYSENVICGTRVKIELYL